MFADTVYFRLVLKSIFKLFYPLFHRQRAKVFQVIVMT